MRKLIVGLKICLISIILTGCDVDVKLDNAKRLMDRPDFKAAWQGSPTWTREALMTINRLEEVIEAGMQYINEGNVGLQSNPPSDHLSPQDLRQLGIEGEIWDAWYTRVTKKQLSDITDLFIKSMDMRKSLTGLPNYIDDSFDCDDTTMLYRALSKFISTDSINPAIGIAIMYGRDKDGSFIGHAAIALVDSEGKLYILDTLSTYNNRRSVLIPVSRGLVKYQSGDIYNNLTIYW